MGKSVKGTWVAAVLGGWIATSAALGADRSAEQILKDLDTVKVPVFDASKRSDQAYIRDYISKRQQTVEKRAELALELYKASPNHQRIPEVMAERWGSIPPVGPKGAELIKEVEDVLAHTANAKLRTEALFTKVQAKLYQSRASGSPDLAAVDEFLKAAPKDPRGDRVLYMAIAFSRDEKAKAALEDRLVKTFPDSMYAGMIVGARRQRESIGKPFDLEFSDAIKGSTVSIKNLKGKVVVIDFWATWCGPCVAEMPHMKELYAKYHDQGVEFIGISLDQPKDQGGLDSLKKFVKDKEIAWPQYYQGNGWESEFSKRWGINSIPSMFVVDQEGKLYSVEARGKLETMIPTLLKKKGTSTPSGAGAGGE
jgi:thiol-disulfide isomerase/thioredoxin